MNLRPSVQIILVDSDADETDVCGLSFATASAAALILKKVSVNPDDSIVCKIIKSRRHAIGSLVTLPREMNPWTGDEHLGEWVYCKQHCGPHTTGWCTVSASEKIPLNAKNREEALRKVRELGLYVFGDNEKR